MKRPEEHIVTPEIVHELLGYDPGTGAFTWKERARVHFKNARAWSAFNTRFAGKEAGTPYRHADGIFYRSITVCRLQTTAHRLAFFYMTGEWPPKHVDHIDGDGLNNRWDNLRLASNAQNSANRRLPKNNAWGFKGVTRYGRHKKYIAQITYRGRKHYLGCFDTPELAHQAYLSAAEELFGEFARSA